MSSTPSRPLSPHLPFLFSFYSHLSFESYMPIFIFRGFPPIPPSPLCPYILVKSLSPSCLPILPYLSRTSSFLHNVVPPALLVWSPHPHLLPPPHPPPSSQAILSHLLFTYKLILVTHYNYTTYKYINSISICIQCNDEALITNTHTLEHTTAHTAWDRRGIDVGSRVHCVQHQQPL